MKQQTYFNEDSPAGGFAKDQNRISQFKKTTNET
jgi:hypothetical protein